MNFVASNTLYALALGGAIEGAVFGLLGLGLAFTFSGAAERMLVRRALIGQEGNVVGTAWLRIDVLPAAAQPEIRALFRRYVDLRLEANRAIPDAPRVRERLARF